MINMVSDQISESEGQRVVVGRQIWVHDTPRKYYQVGGRFRGGELQPEPNIGVPGSFQLHDAPDLDRYVYIVSYCR